MGVASSANLYWASSASRQLLRQRVQNHYELIAGSVGLLGASCEDVHEAEMFPGSLKRSPARWEFRNVFHQVSHVVEYVVLDDGQSSVVSSACSPFIERVPVFPHGWGPKQPWLFEVPEQG